MTLNFVLLFAFGFQKDFSKHNLTADEATDILNYELDSEDFFRVEGITPQNIQDSLKHIKKYFSYPPSCIWLKDKSYKITGLYGEVDYYNDLDIIKTGNPDYPKKIIW